MHNVIARRRSLATATTVALLAACRTSAPAPGSPKHLAVESDTVGARRVFEANIDAIHKRDRARYLSYYLQTEGLTRNGPGGLERGFADWSARRDSTWPDTLVARDLRLIPISPGVVYGTYHYRVTQGRGGGSSTSEGISERVFVNTAAGWKIAVSTAFGLPADAAPPPIALVGATLVNPNTAPVPNAIVIARGGRILCAGPRDGRCAPTREMETTDVAGAWIVPGLIDAHVHYSQTGWVDGRPDSYDVREQFPYDSVVGALKREPWRFDRAHLCSGVTSVFDVGGYTWTFDLARRAEGGGGAGAARRQGGRTLDAPRVVAAGPLLSSRDHWVNIATARQFIGMTSDSIVRATIRAQRALGAGAMKVWYLQLADSLRDRARELLMLAGDESRKAGLPLIVHATQLARAKEALRAGATVLVHAVAPEDVDDEFLALAKKNDAVIIPTLTVLEGYADVFVGRSPGLRYPLECVDAATRAKLERTLPADVRATRGPAAQRRSDTISAATARNIRRMRDAGVAIAMGTDAGNPGTAHGPSVYREMEAMQASGMTSREVLAAATIVAARAMGLEREVGSVEAGKVADLVVLEGDPSANIANARRVRMVMRGGALYGKRELLPLPMQPD